MGLVIEALRCERAGRLVFDGLSAKVERGGALILTGPNGSGKSSLLRVLAGLIPPAAGTVRFGDSELGEDRSEFQAHLLYAGHLDALKPAFTAHETLAFWARYYDADPDGADEALDALGLRALRDHPVRVLSAGQKRRLGLARLALIDRPLWLLDEPTVSLDSESAARIAALARERCKTGGIVVAATHLDLDLPGAQALLLADFTPSGSQAADAVLAGEAW